MLESCIKNDNLYLKNYKDIFDEKYHLDDRFRVVLFEIISSQKPIVALLK
jgi:hypothetical protein